MPSPIRAALLAIVTTVAATAYAQTYRYEPAESIITGVLTRETGETPDGRRITFPAIRLPRPITVEGDSETPTEKGLAILHVILGNGSQTADFKRNLGRRVDITGRLMHSETGHHQTSVLIVAGTIEPAR